jgi:hypothetical protein
MPDVASQAAPGVTAIIGQERTSMAKKNDQAFFMCPRWIEVARALRIEAEFNQQKKIFSIETVWQKIEVLLGKKIATAHNIDYMGQVEPLARA